MENQRAQSPTGSALFELVDIRRPEGQLKRCHPHMFRDTFAMEMLLAGVPIDQVSLLLGHASVKITEKSYAPFVKARQIQLQESVRNAWGAQEPTGGGPENTPPALSSAPAKHGGWQLIHSQSCVLRSLPISARTDTSGN